MCDDGWGDEEANVVCRELGYSIGEPVARTTGQVSLYSEPYCLSYDGQEVFELL